MLNTSRSLRGMVTSPHHLASEAGLRVLREGGTAIEATIAMAACLAVVYPHMTSIGGDGFWLVSRAGAPPVAIDACGAAADATTEDLYAAQGLAAIPWRGPLAANTVAGTISGWGEALRLNADYGGRLPLSRLVEDAVFHAEHGFPVTESHEAIVVDEARSNSRDAPGFAPISSRRRPRAGARHRSCGCRRSARTLRRIGENGADDFYSRRARARHRRRSRAHRFARGARRSGAPSRAAPRRRSRSAIRGARLFNFPPPTQGLASLMILALFDRLGVTEAEELRPHPRAGRGDQAGVSGARRASSAIPAR